MIQSADASLETLEGGEYKASDLSELLGLTYRQLHDWEERAEIVTSERESEEGWRKFTAEKLMALAVCVAVRRQFSLPLEEVGKLYGWLTGKRRDKRMEEEILEHAEATLKEIQNDPKAVSLVNLSGDALSKALRSETDRSTFLRYTMSKVDQSTTRRPIVRAFKLAQLGIPIYLVIQADVFVFVAETDVVRWIAERHVTKPAILCPLNQVFNEVLTKASKPTMELDRFAKPFLMWLARLNDRPDLTMAERKVVALIRARDYQRVTVHVKGGDVIQADVEEDLTEQERAAIEKAILDAVGSKGYQTVTVTEHKGKVTRLVRRTPISQREMVAEKS